MLSNWIVVYELTCLITFSPIFTVFSCNTAKTNPFVLEKSQITAEEDSCVEIKCKPTGVPADTGGAEWFWMKNATWTGSKGFTGTVLYSTDESKRPVSPLFKNRVTYTGSTHGSAGTQQGHQLCQIQICSLSLSDSGIYLFRYEKGNDKWVTEPRANLTVGGKYKDQEIEQCGCEQILHQKHDNTTFMVLPNGNEKKWETPQQCSDL
uniref:Immunoglobulin domain-containing protein n=2 Tax=Oryzias melastigma TaxID=30732 RepID=A0A3B3DWL3_ORYME